jgi:outer membrane protein insertion porin family
MESFADAWLYVPLDFSETYRTYFRLRGVMGKLWSFREQPIPPAERYRLGGYENLRGYPYGSVGPEQRRIRSPLTSYYDYQLGGDKEIIFQFEYLVPLIPKAGIKAVFFADAGQAFSEEEGYNLKHLKKDVGFGFRWLTPIAPFRFEWAYPYIDEKRALGDLQFIFTLGY